MPINFYSQLNALIDDIETNLDGDLQLSDLASSHGLSLSVVERFFPLLAGMSLSEYIRKRRLTLAGRDLAQSDLRVIDVALKYAYESSAAFSRAFEKFHGLKPSEAKTRTSSLKYCPKLTFRSPDHAADVEYEIVELPTLELFGAYIDTNHLKISHDAPQLFLDFEDSHPELPHPDYGMTDCRGGETNYRYWILWRESHPGLEPCKISASRWLKFHIPSQEAREIQMISRWFWENFLPTCCYELKSFPELEFYHDGVTDFYIPIK